ncbi:hypothetical protein [Sorangium sp. So ce1335]|uniref:hypothetical protein n=1 Tax=Sorangium sp. So ce1335 TaxID=3133335 RepID=UPI003F62F2A8
MAIAFLGLSIVRDWQLRQADCASQPGLAIKKVRYYQMQSDEDGSTPTAGPRPRRARPPGAPGARISPKIAYDQRAAPAALGGRARSKRWSEMDQAPRIGRAAQGPSRREATRSARR